MGILIREFVSLYEAFREGRPSALKELGVQYGDYAVWQRQWMGGEVLEKQLRYWREKLRGAPEELELGADRRRVGRGSHRGGRERFVLGKELLEGLKELSREAGVTLFMTLLAGFKVLLKEYSGQEDIVVGSPVANRKPEEVEGLIGFFVNTIVLRTDLSGNPTVKELLGRVRETSLGAYEHQDVPFEKLVEELRPKRNRGYSPFVQAVFAFHNVPLRVLKISGLEIEPIAVDLATSNSDFELAVTEKSDGLAGVVVYDSELFELSTIRSRVTAFQIILGNMLLHPARRLSDLLVAVRQTHEEHQARKEEELKRANREKLRRIKPAPTTVYPSSVRSTMTQA